MRVLILLALPLVITAQEISPEKEAMLGASLAKEHQRRMTVVENAAVVSYLNRLATRLRGVTEFDVSLVANEPDGPLPVPIGLPGGYLIVPTRMIAEAQDEEAFARQMAHAMAHVAARHGWKRGNGWTPPIWMNGIDRPAAANAVMAIAMRAMQEGWEAEANALAEQMVLNFTPGAEFAAIQSAMRALTPARKAPSLRRESEAVR